MESTGAIAELRREISQARVRHDEVQKILAVTEHKLLESQSMVTSLQTEILGLKASDSSTRVKAKPVIELGESNIFSDPNDPQISSNQKSELYRIDEKFTRLDKSQYPAFQRHFRIAISQNADRYITLQLKIALIYQNLGQEPRSFLDQLLDDNGKFLFSSVQDMWDTLDVSYRNPNEKEEARAILCSLRQKGESFGAYLAEFQKYRNLSGLTDNGTLVSLMRAGVSREMQTRISQQQKTTKEYTYYKFVDLCKECQLRIDLDRPFSQLNQTNQPSYQPTSG